MSLQFHGLPDPKTLTIQPKIDRKKFVGQSPAKANTPIDPLEPFEDHVWRGITAWTNVSDVKNPLSTRSKINIPAKHIRASTIENWSTQLKAVGYFVKYDNKVLTISLDVN